MDKPQKLELGRTKKSKRWPKIKVKIWWVWCWHFEVEKTMGQLSSWQAMEPWLLYPHLRTCRSHPVCGYPGKPHADAHSDSLSNLNPKVLKYNFFLCGLQESFMSVQTHLSFIIGRRFHFSWRCITKSSKSLCTVDKLVFHSWGVWGLETSASKRWHLTGNPGIWLYISSPLYQTLAIVVAMRTQSLRLPVFCYSA